ARAADALLDHQLAVEASGERECGGQLAAAVHFADADRTAEVRRLDEDRVGKRFLDELRRPPGVGAPLAAQQRDVRCLRQAGGGEQALHGVLVHGRGGAEDARANVGDVAQLEQSLNRAVLAKRAVQHGKDDVERRGQRVAGLREFGAADVLQRIRGAPPRGGRGGGGGGGGRR